MHVTVVKRSNKTGHRCQGGKTKHICIVGSTVSVSALSRSQTKQVSVVQDSNKAGQRCPRFKQSRSALKHYDNIAVSCTKNGIKHDKEKKNDVYI